MALLFDTYLGKLGYSYFKLKAAQTNCVRIRRSNDNAEQDIGFSGNYVDTAAIASFVSSNSAFVVTWYDQGSAGKNATQATAANQPRIVNAGTLELQNGYASGFFDGSNDVLSFTAETSNTSWSAFTVGKRTASGDRGPILGNNAASGGGPHAGSHWSDNKIYLGSATGTGANQWFYKGSAATDTSADFSIYEGYNAAGTLALYKNNSNISLGSQTNNTTSAASFSQIGRYTSSGSNYTNGYISEVLFYDSDQSANRDAIYEEIRSRYFDDHLEGTDLATGAPTISQPTLAVEAGDTALTGTNLITGAPTITEGAITVERGLTGQDLTTGAPTITQGTLLVEQDLTGQDIATGAPTITQPTLNVEMDVPLTGQNISTGAPTISQPTLSREIAPRPSNKFPTLADPVIPYRIHIGRRVVGDNIIRNGTFAGNANEWELIGDLNYASDPFSNGKNYVASGATGTILRQNGLFVEGKWYRITYTLRNSDEAAGYAALRLGPYGSESDIWAAAPASDYEGDTFTHDRICLKNDYIEFHMGNEAAITDIEAYELAWEDAIDELPQEMDALRYTVTNDESLYGRYVEGMEEMTFRQDGYTTLKSYKTALQGEGIIPIMITKRNEANNEWRTIYEGEIRMAEVEEGYVSDIQESYRYIKAQITDTSAEALILGNRGVEVDLYGYDNPQYFGMPQIWSLLDTTGVPNYIEGYTVFDLLDYMVCWITGARARFDSVSLSIYTPVFLNDVVINPKDAIGIFPADPAALDYRGFTTTFQTIFDQLSGRLALRMKFMRSSGVPVVKIEVAEYDYIMQDAPMAGGTTPTVWKAITQGREFVETYALDLVKTIALTKPKLSPNPVLEIPNRYYVKSDMYDRELSIETEFVFDPTADPSYVGSDLVLYLMKYVERIPTTAADPTQVKAYELLTPNTLAEDATAMWMLRYMVRDHYNIYTLDPTTNPPTEVTVNTGMEKLITEVAFDTIEFSESDVEEIISRAGWGNLVKDTNFRAADTANNIGWWDVDTSWVAFQGIAEGIYQDSQPNIISQQLEGLTVGGEYYGEIEIDFMDTFNSNIEVIWVDATGAKEATILDFTTFFSSSDDYEGAGKWQFEAVCPVDATGIGIRVFSTGSGASMDIRVSRLSLHKKYDATVLDKLIRFDGFRYGRIHNLDLDIRSGEAQVVLRAKQQY